MPDNALLPDKFSAALRICRRVLRYMPAPSPMPPKVLLILMVLSFSAFSSDLTTEKASLAGINWLETLNFDTKEFTVDAKCDVNECKVDVYPIVMDRGSKSIRGCLEKVCATLRYSLKDDEIIDVVHWR
ncbi:hypothetical protein [Rheinheimera soli]|jgi:hypothetical protein|uniref:Uncharacterized protein n=1 Tax=Rheinheimera soli TaxID=443616 RepID=A0ABU1VW04_9GAMM|nr:hypothetical protein [Rheinheimera soli]MDR7119889.1 hypothetical protein [Rheinheimera soli]